MAELILNSNGPHKGSDGKSYYDFDPGNNAMLEAIEAFFANRAGSPEKKEEYLTGMCARSIDEGDTILRKATFFGWLKSLYNLYRRARSGVGGSHKKGNNASIRRRRLPVQSENIAAHLQMS